MSAPGEQHAGRLHPRYRPPVGHLYTASAQHFMVPGRDADTEAELRQAARVVHQVRVKQAREDFGAFMEFCFYDEATRHPYRQQWYHDEWARLWDTSKRALIIAPRDHGKTSQIVGRVLWELGRDPNLRIKVACAADGRSKERLFEIVQHMEHNPYVREVFPHLEPADTGEWSKHKVVVKRTAFHRDASVEALGITATATGGRCDLLIADDVVDRRNALSFPKLRETIKMAWKSDWTNLLEPDSRIWYICTLWHKDDLSHELLKNAEFQALQYAVPGDFGALWAEKWPSEALARRYREIGSVEFNRGFRNQAVDADAGIVRPEWLQFSDLSRDPRFTGRLQHLAFMTSYDPAGSPTGSTSQDYTGAVTIAVDREAKRVFVVDAWRARLTVKAQAEQVFTEWGKYQPVRILIEKVGQSVLDEWLLNDHPELMGVVEVTRPQVSKAQRLLAVTPLLERGQVVFAHHLNADAAWWAPGRGSIMHELLDFPVGQHDDMVDAFSQALHGARRYFLDAWAGAEQNELEIRIGTAGDRRYKI